MQLFDFSFANIETGTIDALAAGDVVVSTPGLLPDDQVIFGFGMFNSGDHPNRYVVPFRAEVTAQDVTTVSFFNYSADPGSFEGTLYMDAKVLSR